MTLKRTDTLLAAGISVFVVLAAPALAEARRGTKTKTEHRTITAKTAHDYWQFHQLTQFKQLGILDLRIPKLFARGRIPGAINIEANKSIRRKLIRLSKKKGYMIYCTDGKTGNRIMALMKKLRFRKVYNINDGMTAWKRRKYPLKRGTNND
jgi:rhodanese-related sulfurtransferase